MNNGVIFIAGVYGVGKSTICNNLNKSLGIPAYSSSKLVELMEKNMDVIKL